MTAKKRICICSAQIPFAFGGTEILGESLVSNLARVGHDAELVRLPLQTQPHEELLKSCLAWRLINLDFVELDKIDLVIATRFPSYMVRQNNKVIWLVHQYRQIYDLYETPYTSFQPTSKDNEIRKYLMDLDHVAFQEAKKIFTISRTVADRLHRWNGIHAEVLYPPVADSADFFCESYEDHVLSVARLAGNKRVHLLIEAMQHVPDRFHAVLVGDGYARTELEDLASKLHLQDRIHFTGHLHRKEVIARYANAGAVFYGPKDEDYGFATLEAFHAHKPVITCSDSGGVLEFVNQENGWIAESNPESIAACIEQALTQKEECRKKGERGYDKISSLNWNHVLDRLLS
jgi:glycosyltransferase involved in cell wall biosynthesis